MRVLLLLFISFNVFANDFIGDWHGQLDIQGAKLRISFHIAVENNTYISTMDSPDQGALGLPTSSTKIDGKDLKISIKNLGAKFSGKLINNKIEGTFSQSGMKLPLNLSKNEIAAAKQKPRKQDPVKPYPYTSEDIFFTNSKAGDIKLAGTLTLPKKIDKPPVAILISGSGPQNRDEEIKMINHRPFLVLSDYLTRNGIAVLRYDDRGVAESEGSHADATTSDFATDTQAAIDYLKTRSDSVDVNKIGLIGHSEGGLIAPMVAADNKDVAFIVLLAGLGIDGAQILLTQSHKASELAGIDPKEISFSQGISEKLFEIVKNELDIEKTSQKIISLLSIEKEKHPEAISKFFSDAKIQEMVKSLSSPWMSHFIRTDPNDFLSKVTCPTLALNGELDFQVIPDLNLNGIKLSLQQAHNSDVTIKELKGLNHLFQKATTGAFNEYSVIEETISPDVLKLITNWINDRFSSKQT